MGSAVPGILTVLPLPQIETLLVMLLDRLACLNTKQVLTQSDIRRLHGHRIRFISI